MISAHNESAVGDDRRQRRREALNIARVELRRQREVDDHDEEEMDDFDDEEVDNYEGEEVDDYDEEEVDDYGEEEMDDYDDEGEVYDYDEVGDYDPPQAGRILELRDMDQAMLNATRANYHFCMFVFFKLQEIEEQDPERARLIRWRVRELVDGPAPQPLPRSLLP